VNIVANYLDRYAVSPFQGAAYINYTGTITNNSYRIGCSARLAIRLARRPSASAGAPACGRPDPSTLGTQGAANAYNEVDFFTSYALTEALTLRGGIDT